MQSFNHLQASSIEEAAGCLAAHDGKAALIAGGTDLLGCLKDRLWLEYPEYVIDLKHIPGLKGIEEKAGGLSIGAMTTLTAISESDSVLRLFPGLAEAVRRTASPLLRNMGTIAGNICQENRCWYYRYMDRLGGMIPCVRKGGSKCLAVPGDSRYHSIFGAVNKCVAVNPSDTAPALVALDATIVTNKREIPAEGFFSAAQGKQSTVLEQDEIVLRVELPAATASGAAKGAASFSAFKKLAFRQSIDFALVNCAAWLRLDGETVAEARICMNGVHNNPVRANGAEELLVGKPLNMDIAEEAGIKALEGAKPLLSNYFKIPMAQAAVADCLMLCKPGR